MIIFCNFLMNFCYSLNRLMSFCCNLKKNLMTNSCYSLKKNCCLCCSCLTNCFCCSPKMNCFCRMMSFCYILSCLLC